MGHSSHYVCALSQVHHAAVYINAFSPQRVNFFCMNRMQLLILMHIFNVNIHQQSQVPPQCQQPENCVYK